FSETSSNDPAASVSRNKSATTGLYSTTRRLTHTRTDVIARTSLPNVVPSAAQAVVVYAALAASTGALGAMARGAVPALQRSSAVALLASLCDASSDNSNEIFTSFGDNPFGLHLSVDDGDHFGNAAGAAVGNMLMVVAVSVASHAIGEGVTCALGRTTKRGSRLAVRIIDALLPSSPIPGAVALPYGTLVQPSVAACLALVTSDGGGGTVALGAAMLLIWLSVAFYFAWQILLKCRVKVHLADNISRAEFALRSEPTVWLHGSSHRAPNSVSQAVVYVMEPTEQWSEVAPINDSEDPTNDSLELFNEQSRLEL
ncbi:transmembrane protein, putative, partial [Bodo saltans]